ncbi:adenosine deaminase [Candidatus Aciduliprofundum boonei]|uniref:Adenosine deaminase n=1 Tax=Aciduliprofundum boonei (strain DSM 19572 / T469) TaxID=439481 RepID=D3TC07_ACIB4|nr:adenosine deaminase [Candidatus Aciduliprofundum boonei]ADD08092.1 adenosine deaminase [Aciduliprofundum boonei T469]HII55534.1 adenosine deaminase [Candidatus Aciduliprofundum boonei]
MVSSLINALPKAELHIHVEGTLEPVLMMSLARNNNVSIPYNSIDEIKNAYRFKNLEDFLRLYYSGLRVLKDEDDFYILTMNYLKRASENNVRHVELSFDPQAHTRRGVRFEEVIEGIHSALKDGERKYGISWVIILSILRDLSVEDALHTLSRAEEYKDIIDAIGLDSAEVGNPPSKFKKVFEKAKTSGFHLVAHAGEEGPPSYIKEAIDLGVERIDHGVRAIEDETLMKMLGRMRIAFTLCPLSNLKLNVVKSLKNYPIREFSKVGIRVTINSDDPAYFGGYINKNYEEVAKALNLKPKEIIEIARNSIIASFASDERKREILREINDVEKNYFESA